MAGSKKNSTAPSTVHVGDRVRFKWDRHDMEGVVVEDRGPLGIGGRRLYGIVFQFEFDPEDKIIELAPSEFVVIESANKANDRPGTAR